MNMPADARDHNDPQTPDGDPPEMPAAPPPHPHPQSEPHLQFERQSRSQPFTTMSTTAPWTDLVPRVHRYPAGARFGVLSDSHRQHDRTAFIARRLVNEEQCTALIHLGDVEEIRVFDAMAGLGVPVHIVLGNCDWDVNGFTEYASTIDLIVDHPLGLIEIVDADADADVDVDADIETADSDSVRCRIAYTHGHLEPRMRRAVRLGVDYLLHGHTHEAVDHRFEGTRVINPGALQRARRYTVGVLDPAAGALRTIEVPKHPAK